MKLGKAPELVKKAAAMLKDKTGVLGARILLVASLRRRMAATAAVSHRIHALVAAAASREKARVDCHRAIVPRRTKMSAMVEKTPPPAATAVQRETVDISRQLALFDQEDGGSPDWTYSLFNDDGDCCHTDEYDDDGAGGHRELLDASAFDDDDDGADDHGELLGASAFDDEPSVMDVIRSSREVEGLEFNMDDEIDRAADMFIRRFRERMNRSF